MVARKLNFTVPEPRAEPADGEGARPSADDEVPADCALGSRVCQRRLLLGGETRGWSRVTELADESGSLFRNDKGPGQALLNLLFSGVSK